jgi:DnaA family protein
MNDPFAMQLTLPVTLPTDETFDSFVDEGNQEVVALLKGIPSAMPAWQDAPSLASLSALHLPLVTLLGGQGLGKSHLLYALSSTGAAERKPPLFKFEPSCPVVFRYF